MFKAKLVSVALIIFVMLASSVAFAEPSKVYPDEKGCRWSWANFNTAYILQEYDKIATSPGCREWLKQTGYSVGGANYHQLPNTGIFISAAIDARWEVSFDYMKPVKGAIVYHDKDKGLPSYSSRLSFIRDVQGETVTIEWMDNKGTIMQKQIAIKNMGHFGDHRFRGYIYPWKVGEKPKE